MSDIVAKEIREGIKSVIKFLEDNGVTVDYVDMKYLDQAVTLYQIIAMGEASSNLARFDGVRYGYRTENYNNLEEMYLKTRQEGFGSEVKRRIMVGSYLLSGANAKIYYDKNMYGYYTESKLNRDESNTLFTYTSPFITVINKNPLSISYYLDIVNREYIFRR